MTVGEWLVSRRPSPPPALARRLDEALGARLEEDESRVFECAMDAAESLLEAVVSHPSSGRECALDLLTADALATYAFEAAASEPGGLVRRAEEAMHRLAAIGARGAA